MRNVYEVKRIRDNVYMITECSEPGGFGVNCFLVIGKEKAVLYDSGFGVVDTLRMEVEKLTDKPVICVVGHGHPDHAGAAELFDEVYMNERDESLLPVSLSFDRRMNDVFGRINNAPELFAYAKEHIVDPGGKDFTYKNIEDGDTISIGDILFEVYAIPGHTQGSIALLNKAENYAFIGDAASTRTALVNMPEEKRAGLISYYNGLNKFLSQIHDDTALYWGHDRSPMPHGVLYDMMRACTEILEGRTENDVASQSHFAKRQTTAGKKMTEHTSGAVTLIYDANLL